MDGVANSRISNKIRRKRPSMGPTIWSEVGRFSRASLSGQSWHAHEKREMDESSSHAIKGLKSDNGTERS